MINISSLFMSNCERFDLGDIEALSESIKQFGLINPILISERSGRFTLIAGRRRLEALKMLGKKTLSEDEYKLISYATINDITSLQLTENVARKNICPIEIGLFLYNNGYLPSNASGSNYEGMKTRVMKTFGIKKAELDKIIEYTNYYYYTGFMVRTFYHQRLISIEELRLLSPPNTTITVLDKLYNENIRQGDSKVLEAYKRLVYDLVKTKDDKQIEIPLETEIAIGEIKLKKPKKEISHLDKLTRYMNGLILDTLVNKFTCEHLELNDYSKKFIYSLRLLPAKELALLFVNHFNTTRGIWHIFASADEVKTLEALMDFANISYASLTEMYSTPLKTIRRFVFEDSMDVM